ncbi:MAG: DNA repair and recombination protein RadB [Nanoarchaeota archaeon]
MSLKLLNFCDEIIGELEKNTITTIYGPPGCGKSTLCFEYMVSVLKENKKVIYIDTEGGFSPERIKQINSKIDLKNIIVLNPKSFEEQHKTISNLNKQIKNSQTISLVVVDSLVMLYRLKVIDSPQQINKELAEQLRLLTQISRSFNIPILVTNQMYVNFETKEKKMIGGTLIEYWSKTILQIDKEQDRQKIVLKKHKCRKAGQESYFQITSEGFSQIKNSRGFNFFK